MLLINKSASFVGNLFVEVTKPANVNITLSAGIAVVGALVALVGLAILIKKYGEFWANLGRLSLFGALGSITDFAIAIPLLLLGTAAVVMSMAQIVLPLIR